MKPRSLDESPDWDVRERAAFQCPLGRALGADLTRYLSDRGLCRACFNALWVGRWVLTGRSIQTHPVDCVSMPFGSGVGC